MSLFGSLFTGVSGLTAQSQSMSMISDNIANVSTTAYKGASTQFSSLVTRQAGSATYRPGGVQTQTQYSIGTQGLLQSSASATDVAIAGGGFFVVNAAQDGSEQQAYTRAGAFSADELGNLKTPTGFFLQGWRLDANEEIANVNRLETVNIKAANVGAVATTQVELDANLDAREAGFTGAYAAGDLATYVNSGGVSGVEPHFTREVQVYDSLGRPHAVTMAVLKGTTPNSWNVELFGEAGDLDPAAHPNNIIASGTLDFAGDGSLAATTFTPTAGGTGMTFDINWAVSHGAVPSSITFDLGTVGDRDGMTQYASEFNVASTSQNGAEVGQLNAISIDDKGYVTASFTNGERRRLYQLPVATFANPLGLDPRSGNVYLPTDAAGDYNLQAPGRGAAGLLTPSALEAANVDLADEFTKMIVTQRAYSANAKVISTADEMLDELIRLRR